MSIDKEVYRIIDELGIKFDGNAVKVRDELPKGLLTLQEGHVTALVKHLKDSGIYKPNPHGGARNINNNRGWTYSSAGSVPKKLGRVPHRDIYYLYPNPV